MRSDSSFGQLGQNQFRTVLDSFLLELQSIGSRHPFEQNQRAALRQKCIVVAVALGNSVLIVSSREPIDVRLLVHKLIEELRGFLLIYFLLVYFCSEADIDLKIPEVSGSDRVLRFLQLKQIKEIFGEPFLGACCQNPAVHLSLSPIPELQLASYQINSSLAWPPRVLLRVHLSRPIDVVYLSLRGVAQHLVDLGSVGQLSGFHHRNNYNRSFYISNQKVGLSPRVFELDTHLHQLNAFEGLLEYVPDRKHEVTLRSFSWSGAWNLLELPTSQADMLFQAGLQVLAQLLLEFSLVAFVHDKVV